MTRNQNRTAVPHLIVELGQAEACTTPARDRPGRSKFSPRWSLLVFLLVCANVANLLLSRVASRQKELSITAVDRRDARAAHSPAADRKPAAVGDGRCGRLLHRALGPGASAGARWHSRPADWRVVAFTAGVTALAGVVFGIAPALRGTRMEVGTALKESSRSVAGANTVLSRGLLVLQVSISLVLLVGAGLFLRTLHNLRSVDIGWNPHNLVFVRVDAEGAGSMTSASSVSSRKAWSRLRAVPGVRHATVSKPTLLSGSVNGTAMYVQGRVYPKARTATWKSATTSIASSSPRTISRRWASRLWPAAVSPIAIDEKAPEVAVINQAAARKFFPNENPIGRKFGHSIDDDPQYRNRRRPAGRSLQRPARAAAGDDVPAASPEQSGGSGLQRPHCRRSVRRDERRAGGDRRRRPQHACRHGGDADVDARAAVRAGESARAGVHPLWRHRVVRRRDRSVRLDVVQRLAAHARDRHPHGNGRRSARRCSAWSCASRCCSSRSAS